MATEETVDNLFVREVTPSKAVPSRAVKPRGAGKMVLVVEDDAQMRKLICAMVQRAGHHPLEAEDGTLALDLARFRNPRLILLDVLMPGLSGLDTLKQIRGMPAHRQTPVVLLTSVRDPEIARDAGKLGVSDFLGKPVTFARLDAKLSKHLD